MIRVRGLELPEVIRDPLGSFVHRLRRSLPAEEFGEEGLTGTPGEVLPAIKQPPARELFNKGVALGRAGQAEEAFGAYDELLNQFVETEGVQEEVAPWCCSGAARRRGRETHRGLRIRESADDTRADIPAEARRFPAVTQNPD